MGLLYGLGAIFARLMFVDWANQWPDKGILVLFSSVFVLAWAATTLPAIAIMQAALQKGMAVIVVPILAGLSKMVPILGGLIALKEGLPHNNILAALRILAFAMILVAAIILSKRAEEELPGEAAVMEVSPGEAGAGEA